MLYIKNDHVAWQVPGGHIERFYREGAYVMWGGWSTATVKELKGWVEGDFGELRKPDVVQNDEQ